MVFSATGPEAACRNVLTGGSSSSLRISGKLTANPLVRWKQRAEPAVFLQAAVPRQDGCSMSVAVSAKQKLHSFKTLNMIDSLQ